MVSLKDIANALGDYNWEDKDYTLVEIKKNSGYNIYDVDEYGEATYTPDMVTQALEVRWEPWGRDHIIIYARNLKAWHMVCHFIITHNIIPNRRMNNEVSYGDLLILYRCVYPRDNKYNLPRLLMKYMRLVLKDSKQAFSFPIFIIKILKAKLPDTF